MIKQVIAIEYSLKDANSNEQLDSNVGQEPLEFISGTGQIIPGLEQKLVTMAVKDKAQVVVEPKDGYGEIKDELIDTLPKEQFADVELEVGMTLYGTGEDGQTVQVMVKAFDDDKVTIDYNHPMAGRTLVFDVEILEIREATDEEIQTGVVGGLAAMGGCGCGDSDCEEEVSSNDGCCGTGHCS